MKFKIVSDIEEAKDVWNKFSPNQKIFDVWDFRYAYEKHTKNRFHFIVGYDNEHPFGVLPLVFNPEKNNLEFFGGLYAEENRVFILPECNQHIPLFYEQIREPAELDFVSETDASSNGFTQEYYKYFTSLEDISSWETFVERNFTGKSKRQFLYNIRKLENENSIRITKNNFQDIEKLFSLNMHFFGENSIFCNIAVQNFFKSLLHSSFLVHCLSFSVWDEVQAVSFAIQYKHNYINLNAGINKNIRDLGKYVILQNMEEAIRARANIFDVGAEDLGWKEDWHLDKMSLFQFKK